MIGNGKDVVEYIAGAQETGEHFRSLHFFPFGAGLMCGVYVTVLVTVSLMDRTLQRLLCEGLTSYKRSLLLKPQSKGERALCGVRALRALNGDRALKGESCEYAGDAGIRRRPSRAEEGAEAM